MHDSVDVTVLYTDKFLYLIYVAPHISSESVICKAFITHSRRQIVSVLQCTRAHKNNDVLLPVLSVYTAVSWQMDKSSEHRS